MLAVHYDLESVVLLWPFFVASFLVVLFVVVVVAVAVFVFLSVCVVAVGLCVVVLCCLLFGGINEGVGW